MNRDRSLEQTILLEDLIVILGALVLSRGAHAMFWRWIPGLKPPTALTEYAHLLLVFLPTWIFAAEKLGIHRLRVLGGQRLEIVRRVVLTQGWGLAAIGLILTAAQTSLNRSLIVTFLALSTVMLLVTKICQTAWLRRHRGQSRALLVGDAAGFLGTEFTRLRGRPVEPWPEDDPEALRAHLQTTAVDEVVLVGRYPAAKVLAFFEVCAEAGLPVFIPVQAQSESPSESQSESQSQSQSQSQSLPRPDIETVGANNYLVYQPREVDALPLAVKAVLDRLLAGVLVVALLPLMLLVAIAVRLFVGPSVLFLQQRGGLYGKPFRMGKFRTMRLGAEHERPALEAFNDYDGPLFKMKNDPRVTRFGHLLRKSSLDELPQLFNVLLGQMSLIGPRPLPLDETRGLTGRYRRRLSMRPGLSCLWQVSGRNDLSFAERMALDLEYVDRWTLGLDLAILLRTLPAILSGRGAR
jgi:lipopolysaccharide/colanic/teichoic acid biosynthesis glycosyltransferase